MASVLTTVNTFIACHLALHATQLVQNGGNSASLKGEANSIQRVNGIDGSESSGGGSVQPVIASLKPPKPWELTYGAVFKTVSHYSKLYAAVFVANVLDYLGVLDWVLFSKTKPSTANNSNNQHVSDQHSQEGQQGYQNHVEWHHQLTVFLFVFALSLGVMLSLRSRANQERAKPSRTQLFTAIIASMFLGGLAAFHLHTTLPSSAAVKMATVVLLFNALAFVEFWLTLRSSSITPAEYITANLKALLTTVLLFPLALIVMATIMVVLARLCEAVGISHHWTNDMIELSVLYAPWCVHYFTVHKQLHRASLPRYAF
eukprot:m.13224 g.13224  ORF g.13224 m.13224 type:complete len:316 (-) comp5919_c0_seq1:650-1597(-)